MNPNSTLYDERSVTLPRWQVSLLICALERDKTLTKGQRDDLLSTLYEARGAVTIEEVEEQVRTWRGMS